MRRPSSSPAPTRSRAGRGTAEPRGSLPACRRGCSCHSDTMSEERIARARLVLDGLSIGDAFGEQLLHAGPHSRAIAVSERQAPSAKLWRWTDDTAMAISIVDLLVARGGIDEEALAAAF